jgi:HSP20 family protein
MEKKQLTKMEPSQDLELSFPFPMLRRFARDFDWFFDRFGRDRLGFEPAQALWAPDLEVFERGNELVVRGDFPGMRKDEVTVEVMENALVFKGERKRETEEKKEGFYRSERTYGSFYRTVPLPEGAKADQAKATLRDGVLEVTMPLAKAEQKTKKLDIEVPAGGEKTKHAA